MTFTGLVKAPHGRQRTIGGTGMSSCEIDSLQQRSASQLLVNLGLVC
jgi:hypothetical protein